MVRPQGRREPLVQRRGGLAFYFCAASLSVCLIQLDSVSCSLAFAALVNSFNSSSFRRTGTIFPLACPFGSFGRPAFLVFLLLTFSILLNDCRSDRRFRRYDRRNM
jgi:hypothetical protein